MSMRLLKDAAISPDASVVDVGGGASVFVDDLIEAGFSDITVLDHSPIGLEIAQHRLGLRATAVSWQVADLLSWTPDRDFDVWHDRAVLHFLLTWEDQQRYTSVLTSATHVNSVVIIGVFSPSGPEMCSGLPVNRYDVAALECLLGPGFERLEVTYDVHTKPDGATQDYLWWVGRRLT